MGDSVTSVLHPSQVASLVGVAGPPTLESTRLAWDIAAVLDGWIEEVAAADWELLNTPTPSRGRTLRHLTVNVFLPIRLLPDAFREGRFPWYPEEEDPKVEAALTTAADVHSYARRVADEWASALLDLEPLMDGADPEVWSPRGGVRWSVLLASQRWHAAFHLRQLISFYALCGIQRAGTFSPDNLRDLDLPDDVF
jgi:hypothetical protein